MKLVTFALQTPLGVQNRIGAVDNDGNVVDVELSFRLSLIESGSSSRAAQRISDALVPASMVDFIEGGSTSLAAAATALEWSEGHDSEDVQLRHHVDDVALLAPVPRPPLLRDFMAFESHLKNIYPKLGREIPAEWYEFPVYYKGNPSNFGANGQDIAVPSYEAELDFEFELAFVIGKRGINISREHALDHVFGMMIYNDFSARVFQGREMAVGLGPAKGKDFQYGHVFGPYLVTLDAIPDPYNLKMVARVNGDVWCDDNSGSIHWKLEDMIAHASRDEWLEVGDVFGTGTVGWGSAAERGTALKRGDVVELEVEHLGVLRNRVV
jgi:2-keto-4-pentenoate hydratase/2-oxohepta-3-ene-1,7-dioic acid hydratase in catechol pathway